jgi:heme oxygenase
MNLRSLQDKVSTRIMSCDIVQQLVSGNISVDQYRRYMSDVYCYALHSAQVIALAGSRLVLSHPPLAQYLFRHAEEELGHDKWAASDLQDLGLSPADIRGIVPSSACARMIGLEYYYAAHANPVGLFGWMFVLESLGGKIGGIMARAVDQTLKLNGKGIYFLRGHGEADAHHSEDLFEMISEHVNSAEDRAAFLYMCREAEELYCGILDNAFLGAQA